MTLIWLILAALALLSGVVIVAGLCSAASLADSLDRRAIDHAIEQAADNDLGAKL